MKPEPGSFELDIAMKRDPAERLEHHVDEESNSGSRSTAIFDASGRLSREGAAALAQTIEAVIAPEFAAYVIRFQALESVDRDALSMLVQWIRGRRDEGLDLRIGATQPHVRALLEEFREIEDALMSLDPAADNVGHRVVGGRHDDLKQRHP